MPRNRRIKYYYVKNMYTVYVFVHPLTKEFFVHYCMTSSLRNAMKDHYTLKNVNTRELFSKYKETIFPPEMYALEEKEMTREEGFVRKILWIRYFKDHHFKPLNHMNDVSCADDLYEENIPKYELIREIDVESIINNSNRLFPHYGRKRSSHQNCD